MSICSPFILLLLFLLRWANSGDTLLHKIGQFGSVEMAEFFCHDVDAEQENNAGETAAYVAYEWKKSEVVRCLLR